MGLRQAGLPAKTVGLALKKDRFLTVVITAPTRPGPAAGERLGGARPWAGLVTGFRAAGRAVFPASPTYAL